MIEETMLLALPGEPGKEVVVMNMSQFDQPMEDTHGYEWNPWAISPRLTSKENGATYPTTTSIDDRRFITGHATKAKTNGS